MDHLIKFFGYDRDISTITHEEAHQYRKWLDERRIKKTKKNPKGFPLAENTKRKHMDNAKVFFNGAKRRGLVTVNAFEYQVSSTRPNRARDYFLTREDTEKIIEVCKDAEWKLLVSLWRYAGLRKMEVFQLTWGDVLWDQGKMRVTIPKTKHHEGKDIRYVPLRDIRQYLRDVFEAALPEGAVSLPADTPIITRFIDTNSNLDKPFKSILHRAGLVPWPKLFQNMRASCETEWLNEGHPAHVVAAWIGHSVKVQRDSYAQITDGHFEKFNSHPTTAVSSGPTSGPVVARNDQNSTKRGATSGATFLAKHEKTPKNQCFPGFQVAAEGFEPPTRGL
jgi:integrase